MRQRHILPRLLGSMILVLLTAGWGKVGHQIINSNVVLHLPREMEGLIQQAAFLASHASDADNRKGGDGSKPFILKEGPRHFIDIDSYPEFATRSVPMEFSAVIATYDSATVFAYGVNPWTIVWTLDSLTAQMQRRSWNSVWQTAADLGHYVGDAHQPLHNTKDFDGRSSLPGSKGIHSRYETQMISFYQSLLTVRPDSVHIVASPIDFAFDIVYQSNSYVDSIYDADLYARQTSGWSGSGTAPQSYYTALWEKTQNFTRLQFQRATENYACLLYAAWINAGSPTMPAVTSVAAAEEQPKTLWLGQNYPNPFNPSTKFFFQIPVRAHVVLAVFTIQGKRVAMLIDRDLSAGSYESSFDAGSLSLSSGMYIYRLQVQTGDRVTTRTNKMVLLK